LINFNHSWTAFTPRVILDYKPLEDVLFYASVSNGFKSGGFTSSAPTAAAAAIPLQPENSWSYESGVKSQFWNRRVTLNLSGYLVNTYNLQIKTLENGAFIEGNAGQAEVRGFELDTDVRLFKGFDIGARYAYTDAYYKSFVNCTASRFNCSGQRLPWTPKNDTLVRAQYVADLSSLDATLTVRADIKWADAYPVSSVNSDGIYVRPLTAQKGILNASVTYAPGNQRWALQLWGKNLTDRAYSPYGANYFFFALTNYEYLVAGQRDVDRVVFAPPRTYGATLSYRF
jgi:iron complex outermembrane receptor protein